MTGEETCNVTLIDHLLLLFIGHISYGGTWMLKMIYDDDERTGDNPGEWWSSVLHEQCQLSILKVPSYPLENGIFLLASISVWLNWLTISIYSDSNENVSYAQDTIDTFVFF